VDRFTPNQDQNHRRTQANRIHIISSYAFQQQKRVILRYLSVCLSHSFCSLNMLVNGGVILRSKYQRSRSLVTKIKCIKNRFRASSKTGSIYIKSTLKMITAVFYSVSQKKIPPLGFSENFSQTVGNF